MELHYTGAHEEDLSFVTCEVHSNVCSDFGGQGRSTHVCTVRRPFLHVAEVCEVRGWCVLVLEAVHPGFPLCMHVCGSHGRSARGDMSADRVAKSVSAADWDEVPSYGRVPWCQRVRVSCRMASETERSDRSMSYTASWGSSWPVRSRVERVALGTGEAHAPSMCPRGAVFRVVRTLGAEAGAAHTLPMPQWRLAGWWSPWRSLRTSE